MSGPRGEVYDLGYRRYDGPREGRMRAHRALWINGVRTVLGIGRGWGSKMLPVVLFVCVMTPAVVSAIIASVVGLGDFELFRHEEYYAIVSIVLALFSAIMAPELLCPDRRDGVIGLYLVRPLTRTDYVAARWFAFLSVTLSFVLAGQVVLFLGLVLAAAEPLEYIKENWLDVPRFLLAGLAVAAFTTTVPLVVSAFTTRRAYATAFVIAVFIISAAAAGILTAQTDCAFVSETRVQGNQTTTVFEEAECDYVTGDAAKWLSLVDLFGASSQVNDRIFPGDLFDENQAASQLHTAVPVAWYLFLISSLGLLLWWRYRSLAA